MLDPVLVLEVVAGAGQVGLERLGDRVAVVLVDAAQPLAGSVAQVGLVVAEHLLPARGQEQAVCPHVPVPQAVVGALHGERVALLGLGEAGERVLVADRVTQGALEQVQVGHVLGDAGLDGGDNPIWRKGRQMSTGLIIAIVVAALVLVALFAFVLPRARRGAEMKKRERELEQRREHRAEEHRAEAAERRSEAEMAEQRARMAETEAQRERAEAELREQRAQMHERGMADHELIDESERDRFAGTSAMRDEPGTRDDDSMRDDGRRRRRPSDARADRRLRAGPRRRGARARQPLRPRAGERARAGRRPDALRLGLAPDPAAAPLRPRGAAAR